MSDRIIVENVLAHGRHGWRRHGAVLPPRHRFRFRGSSSQADVMTKS